MLLIRAQEILESQPFSNLLGAEITSIDQDNIVMELPLKKELLQQFGFAHGGVISYLADNLLTFAAAHSLGEEIVTLEMKINYLRPATGQRLIARGLAISATRNIAVTRCEIFCKQENSEYLCAAAQATITRLGAKTISAV